MRKSRTALFRQLHAQTVVRYLDTRWPSAKRWVARVGIPRLAAEEAVEEASGLLNSIHMGIHRNEPELEQMLYDARRATYDYKVALNRDDWRRFEGRPKP